MTFDEWHKANAKYMEPVDIYSWTAAAYEAGYDDAVERFCYPEPVVSRDNVIRMAREAGYMQVDPAVEPLVLLGRFATIVAASMRESCAELCLKTEPFYGVMFANAIRARGEE